jgi:hypothetical protein
MVSDPGREPDRVEGGGDPPATLGFGKAGEDHWELHVLRRRQPRNQMEELKNKSDLMAADVGELGLFEDTDVTSVQPVGATGGPIQAPDDVEQCRFT